MVERVRSRRAEGYVDVAVTVLIVAFVLIVMVNLVSLIVTHQNMKVLADQIAEYAAVNGSTDVEDYIEEQKKRYGFDFTCDFSGSQWIDGSENVQLGSSIVCTVNRDIGFLGFGKVFHSLSISASSSALSQVYWK